MCDANEKENSIMIRKYTTHLYFLTEFTGLMTKYLTTTKPSVSFLWRMYYVCSPWRAEW